MEERPVEMDLRFASIRFSPTGIEVAGKRGNPIKVGEEVREVPPVSGEFKVPLDRFIEMIGGALTAGSLVQDEQSEEEQPEQSEQTKETEKKRIEDRIFSRFLRGRPERTTLRIIGGIFRRPAVRLSVALIENGEIKARTAGTISAERALVLMDMAGKVLKKGRYMRPLSAAALLCEGEKLVFMFGNRETGLTEAQQKELKYILSRKFFGDKRPVRFRVGRFSLVEEDIGKFILRFSMNRREITPGDLAVIRAVLA